MKFQVQGKKAIVVGLGASGRSAARLLVQQGAEVLATDTSPDASLGRDLEKLGVRLALGGHAGVDFAGADLIVVSPGVPPIAELAAAEQAGALVMGEVELASRFIRAPIVAIGGTNGKSTTTTLVGHLLEAAGVRAFVGGNLGEPACDAPEQNPDVVVFEVSSFQMERVHFFRPKVGVLLNITEDHLDRYPDFQAYARAKGNCFQRQGVGDVVIAPGSDARCLEQIRRGRGELRGIGPGADYEVSYANGRAAVFERRTQEHFPLDEADLHGRHNHLNAAAAVAAVRALGISKEAILEGLRRFMPLPHRMTLSGRFRGVSFYNDSKATNVGAAVTALRGITEPKAVVLLGGRDKLGSYEELVAALQEKARFVVTLGEAAERIEEAIAGVVPFERVRTLPEAVLVAFRHAERGDAVLLSPACSSLDMFKNYSERGERFTEAVRALSRFSASEPPPGQE
jgi:UDP-N-acetylmuramoylalanine--D-glutamate ligase